MTEHFGPGIQPQCAGMETAIAADALVGQIFRALGPGMADPRDRFRVFEVLLMGTGSPIGGLGERWADLLPASGQQCNAERGWIEQHATLLGQQIPCLEAVTYMVVSYWSPIDHIRRSVGSRRGTRDDELRPLVSAVVFYGLTFASLPHGFSSLVQLLGSLARQRHPLDTHFEPEPGDPTSTTSLVLDEATEGDLVAASGVLRLLASTEAFLSSPPAARSYLSYLMSAGSSWRRDAFAMEVDDFLSRFPEAVTALSTQSRARLREWSVCISAHLGTSLDPVGTAFVALMQAVWRMACPGTSSMYLLPIDVADTCCALTVGTNRRLTDAERLWFGSFAKSLFLHPLLADYAAREELEHASRRLHLFRRLLGHNLPKMFASPGARCARRLAEQIEQSGQGHLVEAASTARQLEVLFDHYGSFLRAIMDSGSLRAAFSDATRFDVVGELPPQIEALCPIVRERFVNQKLKRAFRISVSSAHRSVQMEGNLPFITEMVFNAINNAAENLVPAQATTTADGATVAVKLSVGNGDIGPYLRITIQDRGRGFSPERLLRYQELVDTISSVEAGSFWPFVDKLLNDAWTTSQRAEENLGIGIVFNCIYLRSLEFQERIRRPGRALLRARPGGGSEVELQVPGVREIQD